MKTSIAVALVALCHAGAAGAQICVGHATDARQGTLGGTLLFPTGDFADPAEVWGLEGSYNVAGPLGVFGGFTVFDFGTDSDEIFWEGGVAWEIAALGDAIGPRVSVCPTAGLHHVAISDVGSSVVFPVGFGIGTDLAAGSGVTVSPWLEGFAMFSKFDFDDDAFPGMDSETGREVGTTAGVVLSRGSFWVGGLINHVFDHTADPAFALRAGIRL